MSLSDFEMAGVLSKRTEEKSGQLRRRLSDLKNTVAVRLGTNPEHQPLPLTDTVSRPAPSRARSHRRASPPSRPQGEWRDRYFVLKDCQLRYWQSEAEFAAGKPRAT